MSLVVIKNTKYCDLFYVKNELQRDFKISLNVFEIKQFNRDYKIIK